MNDASEQPPVNTTVSLNPALPTWAIDTLMFGIATKDKPDATKVWAEFVRIAMSAQRRGWTRNDFLGEVTREDRGRDANGTRRWQSHRLWWQLYGYSHNVTRAYKSLDRAWDIAAQNLRGDSMRTAEDIKATAIETAYLWTDRLLAGTDGLGDAEFLVMEYVVTEVERRGMSRVTCPVRAVAEHAKVSKTVALRTLKKLSYEGFLVQYSSGIGGRDPSRRRAAIYSLGDPEGTYV